MKIVFFLSWESAVSTNRNLTGYLTEYLTDSQTFRYSFSKSTRINPNQPESTQLNPYQPESTQIKPNQPESACSHYNSFDQSTMFIEILPPKTSLHLGESVT